MEGLDKAKGELRREVILQGLELISSPDRGSLNEYGARFADLWMQTVSVVTLCGYSFD